MYCSSTCTQLGARVRVWCSTYPRRSWWSGSGHYRVCRRLSGRDPTDAVDLKAVVNRSTLPPCLIAREGRNMHRNIAMAVAIIAIITSSESNAQLGSLLGKSLNLPANGQAGGTYQSNSQVRTFVTSGPYEQTNLYAQAITKAGEMTNSKGYSFFAVRKYQCSTVLMDGVPRAKSCYVIAVMLAEAEGAKARGSHKVQYYRVEDVLAGRIAAPVE